MEEEGEGMRRGRGQRRTGRKKRRRARMRGRRLERRRRRKRPGCVAWERNRAYGTKPGQLSWRGENGVRGWTGEERGRRGVESWP